MSHSNWFQSSYSHIFVKKNRLHRNCVLPEFLTQ
ncbi:unnamed protein product [Schistosoma mattheei]|uniref:Uncharacterized protein n=1 Tax=Schistosoma mattheei TaxID=31246 RepID=A0A183PPL9_9TREM|nr:unnamed protein product [Schistosoma mattheei]